MCATAVSSIYDVHQLVDFYRLAYKAGYGFGEATSGAYPLVSGVPPAGVFGGSPTLKARDVSFDTSSKEPHLVRARVFVGNMNTNVITRDDIIRLFSAYGTLLGVTVFKGYAFIQYGTSTEADLAVSALNGYSWNGSILDVKLAIAGMKSHNVTSTVSTSNGVKRGAENFSGSSANAKKERLDDYGKTAAQNNRNRQTAATDSTESRNLYETGMPDTLICGGCRFVTSDFEEFREHREVENEEMKWQCSMCDEVCTSGGTLIDHALDRHNIRLLKNGAE
ncbi:hypothetical protein X798_00547 [Onchocerca flexuosa]|uniref:RRM domain-containing protein n=1 Tax=Onchocerca flexuosa TaxID=387005 RepID=A0A238C634_9BILA|nr:hypothetical protein X798_00547 [Onchocerca flexuosa]